MRDQAFLDKAFKEYPEVPKDLRRVAERIVSAYNIRGICDPIYIANIIAYETGRGNGCSEFESTPCPDCGRAAGHRRELDCIG